MYACKESGYQHSVINIHDPHYTIHTVDIHCLPLRAEAALFLLLVPFCQIYKVDSSLKLCMFECIMLISCLKISLKQISDSVHCPVFPFCRSPSPSTVTSWIWCSSLSRSSGEQLSSSLLSVHLLQTTDVLVVKWQQSPPTAVCVCV